MKEKSIKEWLQELPDGYRELALANTKEPEASWIELNLPEAIWGGFVWKTTPQGFDFWLDVIGAVRDGSPYPPLPGHSQDPTNEAEANLQIMDQRDRAIELLKKCCGRLVFYGDYETVPELDEFLATVKTINPNV